MAASPPRREIGSFHRRTRPLASTWKPCYTDALLLKMWTNASSSITELVDKASRLEGSLCAGTAGRVHQETERAGKRSDGSTLVLNSPGPIVLFWIRDLRLVTLRVTSSRHTWPKMRGKNHDRFAAALDPEAPFPARRTMAERQKEKRAVSKKNPAFIWRPGAYG